MLKAGFPCACFRARFRKQKSRSSAFVCHRFHMNAFPFAGTLPMCRNAARWVTFPCASCSYWCNVHAHDLELVKTMKMPNGNQANSMSPQMHCHARGNIFFFHGNVRWNTPVETRTWKAGLRGTVDTLVQFSKWPYFMFPISYLPSPIFQNWVIFVVPYSRFHIGPKDCVPCSLFMCIFWTSFEAYSMFLNYPLGSVSFVWDICSWSGHDMNGGDTRNCHVCYACPVSFPPCKASLLELKPYMYARRSLKPPWCMSVTLECCRSASSWLSPLVGDFHSLHMDLTWGWPDTYRCAVLSLGRTVNIGSLQLSLAIPQQGHVMHM